jgi:hypothetical protein
MGSFFTNRPLGSQKSNVVLVKTEKVVNKKRVIVLNKIRYLLMKMAKILISSTAFGTGRSPQELARHGQNKVSSVS